MQVKWCHFQLKNHAGTLSFGSEHTQSFLNSSATTPLPDLALQSHPVNHLQQSPANCQSSTLTHAVSITGISFPQLTNLADGLVQGISPLWPIITMRLIIMPPSQVVGWLRKTRCAKCLVQDLAAISYPTWLRWEGGLIRGPEFSLPVSP